MSPDWFQWVQAIVGVMTLLLVCLVIPLLRWVRQVRENELKHISEEIGLVRAEVKGVADKINGHVQWHLNNPGEGPG